MPLGRKTPAAALALAMAFLAGPPAGAESYYVRRAASGTGGLTPGFVAHDCQDVLEADAGAGSGVHSITPAGLAALDVVCDMAIDGGGWTRVTRINRDSALWNAFTAEVSLSNSAAAAEFNIPLSRFTATGDGRDLELMVKIDGVQRGFIFKDVPLSIALDPDAPLAFFDTAISQKSPGGSYAPCYANFYIANTDWNWAIGTNSATGCAGYK